MKRIILIITLSLFFCQFNTFGQTNIDSLKTVQKLKVSGNVQVELYLKNDYALELKSDDLEMECVEHSIENGVLTIRIKTNFDCSGEARAILTLPSLREINLSGQSELSTHDLLKRDSLTVIQQLGSKVVLDVDVKYLHARLSEGSVLEIGGYADHQEISVSTKASFSASELKSETSNISASMLGIAKVCVSKDLKASASASAYVYYSCSPENTEFKKSLGGKIEVATEEEAKED